MKLTVQQLQQATSSTVANATKYLAAFNETLAKYQINTPVRVAHFLAQIGHESISLGATTESLNYPLDRLLKTFSRARISAADAAKFARTDKQAANQPEIGNRVYGGTWGLKNLGNTTTGDGYKFRGRGPIQITGRANYRAVGKALGVDLEDKPERINEPAYYANSAGHYWNSRGLNALADMDSGKWSETDQKVFETITRKINGGVNGLADRIARYKQTRKALGLPS